MPDSIYGVNTVIVFVPRGEHDRHTALDYGEGSSELTMTSPASRMSINHEPPPSYFEARNSNNLSPRNPTDVPSLHSPSIVELPYRPAEQDAGGSGGAYEAPDVMPTLSMLGPPAELFPDAAPYYMMLTCNGPTARISGSHQPSLRLIAEYFKKWGRLSPPKPNGGSVS